MTTNNHTAMALSVAIASQNSTAPEKVGILAVLAVSHLVADAIPHGHYYEFKKLRHTWSGAILEVGIGFFGLTILVWYITSVNILWLFTCAFATSFFDFLVFAGKIVGVRSIGRFNHWLHWWDKNHDYPNKFKWRWEIAQTVVLAIILYFSILKYG